MSQSQERILIARAKAGDTQAFETLVSSYAPFVFNVALRTLGNSAEAEDIAQEAFVRVWRNLKSFRGDAQFKTWLYRIVTNLCYNRLPRLKKELSALDPDEQIDLADTTPSIERDLVDVELRAQLHNAIDQLPESYRLLISLRHLQGMSYAEIAKATNLPLGSVKTGIFRARRELRAMLIGQISSN